jgi:ABC-type nitrate/sulfonate/bicarbonate transport system permease component
MTDLGLRALGIAAALLLWEVIGRMFGTELFAPPSTVIPELIRMLAEGEVLAVLGHSLLAMLAGYVAACVVAVPLGVAMGRTAWCDMLLHPWLSMFIVTSVAAVVPVLILMLGTGFLFRMAIVFLAAVWYVMLTVYQGARRIEPRWMEVGRSFGAPRNFVFRKIVLPAILPYVMVALRIGLTHAIRAMVVAELFVLVGFGKLLHDSGFDMSTAPMLALLVLIAAVGIAANVVLDTLARWVAPWSNAHEQPRRA